MAAMIFLLKAKTRIICSGTRDATENSLLGTIIRLEKAGTLAEEQENITAIEALASDASDEEKELATSTGIQTRDWTEDKGKIIIPEPLTGNSFSWTEGQELLPGEQLDYNDVVKKDTKFFKYTGSALAYEAMPVDEKAIIIQEAGAFIMIGFQLNGLKLLQR